MIYDRWGNLGVIEMPFFLSSFLYIYILFSFFGSSPLGKFGVILCIVYIAYLLLFITPPLPKEEKRKKKN